VDNLVRERLEGAAAVTFSQSYDIDGAEGTIRMVGTADFAGDRCRLTGNGEVAVFDGGDEYRLVEGRWLLRRSPPGRRSPANPTWLLRLLADAHGVQNLRDGPDGEIVESIVVDFPGKQVRPYADEKVRYRFKTGRALIEHLIHIDEGDWVNSLFLSCRFSAARIGQYNEFVYAFFKCLSEERLQYAEGWYDEHERTVDAVDTQLGDWTVQRRCPHLKADLSRFGIVDGNVLTCQLHGWKFDLPTGKCLTSVGHKIRAEKTEKS